MFFLTAINNEKYLNCNIGLEEENDKEKRFTDAELLIYYNKFFCGYNSDINLSILNYPRDITYIDTYEFEPIPEDVLLQRNAQTIAEDKAEEEVEKTTKKENNKAKRTEKSNEKITCQCGGVFTLCQKSRHEKTKKHVDFINRQA